MASFGKYFQSSIGKKQIMALSAIMLIGFTIVHLLGNLFMFAGAETFNMYSYKLTSNGVLLAIAEVILAIIFFTHIIMGFKLTLENRFARPDRYYVKAATGRGATLASSTMPITGTLTLIFIGFHLSHFRLGEVYLVNYNGLEVRDMFRSVVQLFQNPAYIIFYILAMFSLGIHISHGAQSIAQSLGFNHPRYTPKLKIKSLVFALFIAIAFSAFPVWAYFQGGVLK